VALGDPQVTGAMAGDLLADALGRLVLRRAAAR
jgi:hypothetical protein